MDLERINALKQERQRQNERSEELGATKDAGDKIARAISDAVIINNTSRRIVTHKVKSIEPLATPKDIAKVVKALDNLGQQLAPQELKPVVDSLKTVVEAINKLPREYPTFPEFPKFPQFPKTTKVDNLKDIQPWLKEVVEAIGKIELSPKIEVNSPEVNVPETKLDLTPLNIGLTRVEKAVSGITIPGVDFTDLLKAVRDTNSTLSNLKFPVPNYVLPFKDKDGKAVQARVADDGTLLSGDSGSSTSSVTSVNDTASSTQLLAANPSRKEVIFSNDSTSTLYVKLGATASTTSYTAKLSTDDTFITQFTGRIDGIWSSDASGAVRITELT